MNPNPDIHIFNNHPGFNIEKELYQKVVSTFLQEASLPTKSISIIFVTDDYLKDLHRQYLNDDSYTDVMTFNLGESAEIEGEIYISLDRAQVQANEYGVELENEIARLIIHGLLHLQGYDDRTEDEKRVMRELEDRYLEKIFSSSSSQTNE